MPCTGSYRRNSGGAGFSFRRAPGTKKRRVMGAWPITNRHYAFQRGNYFKKDWGAFPGENRGYLIAEGSQLDVMKMTQQYTPYVNFKIHPVSAVGEIEALLEHMAT
jgi:hypothetical protein